MASCISRCKDTSFNVEEMWECEWDVQFKGEAARDVQFEGEAAKDYQDGHGWDECQGGVHAKRVTIMPKEFQQKKKKWYG